ncbi:hypothetical protein CXB51_022168 [Gossypium anomalum]|uniref:Tf2-1-like SH3-like domain-containing protein n=1 Tax=Gossypium anomalum TaxID=47600 RepID=A0A8J5YJL4_9ROSI|nr:hypothetical protein CXB51_022168 [Gossypium anomalum]
MVADALSKKSPFSLRAMNTRLSLSDDGLIIAELKAGLTFLQQISEAQKNDSELQAKRIQSELTPDSKFQIGTEDRDPQFTSRFLSKLQETLGTQLHFSTVFHPQTDGQSECVIQILEDMLRCCILEFEELSEKKLHGVDLVCEAEKQVKVIWYSLKAASDRQKSYADLKRKKIEFQVNDKVFLKLSPWKKVLLFDRKGKLSPRFIGPYEIIERIRPDAYLLVLPPELDQIHNVFHVSMLRRYRSDPSHVISLTEVEIQPDMKYSEKLIKILAREIKELRNKKVAFVKVLWQRHGIEEASN